MNQKAKRQGVPDVLLPTVTLICVSGVNIEDSVYALWRSSRSIKFGAVKIISPHRPSYLPEGFLHEVPHESKLDSIDSYSHYMIYDLWRHVDTDHCLVVQADGYVLDESAWSYDFLRYDYIGAPWRVSENAYLDPWGRHVRVGNGGFSLRSKKLLEIPLKVHVPWDVNSNDFYKHMNAGLFSEDGNICVHNRHIYEGENCEWAPIEVALSFSREKSIEFCFPRKVFGYHKKIRGVRNVIRDKVLRAQFAKEQN